LPDVINITASGLSKASHMAKELAEIESALDTPPEYRKDIAALVGLDGYKVSVPWSLVQQELQDKRAKLHLALQEMGINLLPPDPKEEPALIPVGPLL
jgi:hypothetical protein